LLRFWDINNNDYPVCSGNRDIEYVILVEGHNMWCPPELIV